MQSKMIGKQSIMFEHPPFIIGGASVVGEKEGQGPLGQYFDVITKDPMCGGKTWEEAEGNLQKAAAEKAIEKAGAKKEEIRYLLAGDLLDQLIATSFGIMSLQIPLFGVYGACSTMGESLSLGAILVEGGFADKVVALTSSHNASAERQFRFPLAYGNQKPLSATWTVTGSGAIVLSKTPLSQGISIRIRGITTGKVVDYGIKDSMNMGACMAPAAFQVISQNFEDFSVDATEYDKIITGDLGLVGKKILLDMLLEKGYDIEQKYMDCGIEIYNIEEQDVHSGGSGCGCSATVLAGYILEQLKKGVWKKILFVPTGALLSKVSYNEGRTVPGIAHGVIIEAGDF